MVAELRFLRRGRSEKRMDFGARGIGDEIKLVPPPLYRGELDKWDDWSWQQKRYVGLYKPLAKTLMDEIETNPTQIVTDGLCEAYDVQQTQTQNNQLSRLRDLAKTVQSVFTAEPSSCNESLE